MTPVAVAPYEVVCDDTRELSRPEWLERRRVLGFGASEAAGASNLSPWDSQYRLWALKRGILADAGDSWRFEIALDLEPLVLRWWCKTRQIDPASLVRHRMLRSTRYPFMFADPDAECDELDAVIEAKTCSEFDARRWEAGLPDHYTYQGLHLMLVTGRPLCIFPVCFGFAPPVEYLIRLSDFTPQQVEALVENERELWRRVQENDPPDPDGSEAAMEAVKAAFCAKADGTTKELPQRAEALIGQHHILATRADQFARDADAIKQQLILMLEGADSAQILGEPVYSYRENSRGVRSFRWATWRKGEVNA